MKRFYTFRAALAAAGLVLASVPAQAGILGDAISKQINGHGDGPTWTEHADSFKGASQVVLGQFTVVFLTKSVSYSGGGFLSTANTAKAIGRPRRLLRLEILSEGPQRGSGPFGDRAAGRQAERRRAGLVAQRPFAP